MVRVDLVAASRFYGRMLGLRPLWRDEVSIGMGLPETDAEVVLHTMDLPRERGVHYLVDSVVASVCSWREAGCVVREPPFEFWLAGGVLQASMNVNVWDVVSAATAVIGRPVDAAKLADPDVPLADVAS